MLTGIGRLLVAALLLVLTPAAAWGFPTISDDGKCMEISRSLPADQETIVFFHAPWSKTASRYLVELTEWEKKQDKTALLGVRLKTLTDPVAKQYKVTSLPWFLIYDAEGQLIQSGPPALNEVLRMMKKP